jgi:hypothetical protein
MFVFVGFPCSCIDHTTQSALSVVLCVCMCVRVLLALNHNKGSLAHPAVTSTAVIWTHRAEQSQRPELAQIVDE